MLYLVNFDSGIVIALHILALNKNIMVNVLVSQNSTSVPKLCWKLEIPINWLVSQWTDELSCDGSCLQKDLLVDLASTKKYGDLIPAKTEYIDQDQRLTVMDHLKQ